MGIENYYAVCVNRSPFIIGKEKEIGCYSSEYLAKSVSDFVRDVFSSKVEGGIACSVVSHKGKLLRTPAGLRLEETPNGRLAMIDESWNSKMVESLLTYVPFVIDRKAMEQRTILELKGRIDQPLRICEEGYHAVVLKFEPFDDSHKLFAGYYKTKKVAKAAAMFIINLHSCHKVGFGFHSDIISLEGKYVEYESGKSYIKVDGADREVKDACDVDEYLRLIKAVDQSINKWSM